MCPRGTPNQGVLPPHSQRGPTPATRGPPHTAATARGMEGDGGAEGTTSVHRIGSPRWNSLYVEAKLCKNVNQFKRKFRKGVFEMYKWKEEERDVN